MSTVETVSPRTIRARSITKDLSGEELRALARSGEKTTEYGSPVYATRIKNRSAKKTYIVNDVPVGVMQQPIERREGDGEDPRGPGSPVEDGPDPGRQADGHEPRGPDPLPPLRAEGVRAHRVHVAQHALPVGLLEGARLHLGVRARLAGDLHLLRRRPGLHVHPRHRLPRRGEEVDAAPGHVLDQAQGRPRPARRLEDPARPAARREARATSGSCSSGSRAPARRR